MNDSSLTFCEKRGVSADEIERLQNDLSDIVCRILTSREGRSITNMTALDRLQQLLDLEKSLNVSPDFILSAWRKYSKNPYSNHPCENFKAGFVAANLISRGEEPSFEAIAKETRKMRF